MNQTTIFLTALAGTYLGYYLPDIDVAPLVPLKHRSAWTHGPFLPLGAMWLLGQFPQYRIAFICALAGLTVHLIADISPRKWYGSAFINWFPLKMSWPAALSFLYIGASTFVAIWCLTVML